MKYQDLQVLFLLKIFVARQKKLIDFFGRCWHKPEDEETRIVHFRQYGFNTLIIWEEELSNLEILKEKIRTFNGAK